MARATATMSPQLRDAVSARAAVRSARRSFHLSLLIAKENGHDVDEIAKALDTKPLYVANTLRLHAEHKCGCEA